MAVDGPARPVLLEVAPRRGAATAAAQRRATVRFGARRVSRVSVVRVSGVRRVDGRRRTPARRRGRCTARRRGAGRACRPGLDCVEWTRVEAPLDVEAAPRSATARIGRLRAGARRRCASYVQLCRAGTSGASRRSSPVRRSPRNVAGRGLFVDVGRARAPRAARPRPLPRARRARASLCRRDLVEQVFRSRPRARSAGRERAKTAAGADVRPPPRKRRCFRRREGEGSHFLGLDGTAARPLR